MCFLSFLVFDLVLLHALHTFPFFSIGVACFLLLIFFKVYYFIINIFSSDFLCFLTSRNVMVSLFSNSHKWALLVVYQRLKKVTQIVDSRGGI